MGLVNHMLDMEVNDISMRSALAERMTENDENIEDINNIVHYQSPFLCGNNKYYSEALFETDEWLYCCRNNAGDGIIITVCDNPAKFKPECPEGAITFGSKIC